MPTARLFSKQTFGWICMCLVVLLISCTGQPAAPSDPQPSAQQPAAPQPAARQPAAEPAKSPVDSPTQLAGKSEVPATCPPCASAKAAEVEKAVLPGGLGILGDSFYDEYQGDDNRGGASHSTTFNLVEILVHTRHFDLGPWGKRDEPRRTGYAYNWARSGATSESMIEQGQHTGLAEQIRQGLVSYVWIGIGANDFNPYFPTAYQEIYNGTMTDAQIQEKIDRAVANVTLAVETVQEAGAKGIVVTHFTQWDLDPLLSENYPDAAGRRRVAEAINAVNEDIQAMADEKGIAAFNQNMVGMNLLPKLVENRYLLVADQRIDFAVCGDEPQFSRLADLQHLGTVMSGISTNYYFINTFNEQFGMEIQPLSDEEILRIAGFPE